MLVLRIGREGNSSLALFETYGQGAKVELEFRGSVLEVFTVVTVKSDELVPVSLQPLAFLTSTLVALSTAVGLVSEQIAAP